MSRFDLDRLRVTNILEMQKEWVAKRNLAVAVRTSFGRKLIEEASFVFISPRGAITYQQTASQLDPTILDESVAQPAGSMLPSWFSERFALASRDPHPSTRLYHKSATAAYPATAALQT
jgi:hypothetical protein